MKDRLICVLVTTVFMASATEGVAFSNEPRLQQHMGKCFCSNSCFELCPLASVVQTLGQRVTDLRNETPWLAAEGTRQQEEIVRGKESVGNESGVYRRQRSQ